MPLEIARSALETLLAEAKRAHPEECCGLLSGRNGRIEAAQPAKNVHSEPLRRFEIDPRALIAAERAVREGGPELLGYYHSHPTGRAEPSATDRAEAAGDGRIWGIVAGGDVAFWRDGESGFAKLSYTAVDR